MSKRKYNGKVGYCTDKALGFGASNSKGGHYVYVRSDDGDKCVISTITSLEDSNLNLNNKKLRNVENGYIYPIPKNDANFNRWSGVNVSTLEINKSNIKQIDNRKIRRKHKLAIGKVWK